MPAKKPPANKAPKMRPDAAETAFRVMQEATGQAPKTVPGEGAKNPDAASRGAKGGKRGGRARAKALSPAERQDVARVAAQARWKKAAGSQHPEDHSQS